MTSNTNFESVDDECDDDEVDPSANDDWITPVLLAGELRGAAASRRAIEIAKEERALRAVLEDFSDNE